MTSDLAGTGEAAQEQRLLDIPTGTLNGIGKALEGLPRKEVVEVMAKRSYVARYERDENGYWSAVVKVDAKRTAISDGQTLPKARRRIRQSLALLLDVTESAFDLKHNVVLPAGVKRALAILAKVQEAARIRELELDAARRAAVEAIVTEGISRRDAGEILGVTGSRVQQLLAG